MKRTLSPISPQFRFSEEDLVRFFKRYPLFRHILCYYGFRAVYGSRQGLKPLFYSVIMHNARLKLVLNQEYKLRTQQISTWKTHLRDGAEYYRNCEEEREPPKLPPRRWASKAASSAKQRTIASDTHLTNQIRQILLGVKNHRR